MIDGTKDIRAIAPTTSGPFWNRCCLSPRASREHTLREIINGIRYVVRYGIPWDAMPKDLPPHSLCYDYWRLLSDGGHLDQINHLLVMADREKSGREASPSLVIVDAQSVKCDAPQGERGYDAGKKVTGRKRHFAVDCEGRLLAVDVTSADVQDQDGGLPLAWSPCAPLSTSSTAVTKITSLIPFKAPWGALSKWSKGQSSPRDSCFFPNGGVLNRALEP